MTKLSSSFSYKVIKKYDEILRFLSSKIYIYNRFEIWSDASGKGYGGHLGPQKKPFDVWKDKHEYLTKSGKGSTEYIEAKALLLSLEKWKNQLKGKKVWCYIDNYQVYQTLKRKYSPSTSPISFKKLYFTSNIINYPIFLSNNLSMTPSYLTSYSTIPNKQLMSFNNNNISKNNRSKVNIKCPEVKATFDEIDNLITLNEITLKARWVWGKDNFLADKLSRLGNGNGKGTLTPHVVNLLKMNSDIEEKQQQNTQISDNGVPEGGEIGLSISNGNDTRVA
ncbi:uncharacterized protein L201_003603 [Kwoniella dendrophila CBS 6074]|uniref:RNase H type-1 domain-containing protein n=1 Tax=Kwoniella dendrophila CBS 6074 TaxID=1295534 RepID=A0AAX4JTD5_9TREE